MDHKEISLDPERFHRQVEGALLGLAVADALGVPVEFTSRAARKADPVREMRSGGTHGQPAGTWSDDTSMTLGLMDSLTEAGIDTTDQMERYVAWIRDAKYTAGGEVFDFGGITRNAILRFMQGNPPEACGMRSENSCGNGSLMRIVPLPLYLYARRQIRELNALSAEIIHCSSDCTHAHPRCEMACGIFSAVVFELCAGRAMQEAVDAGVRSALAFYRSQPEHEHYVQEFASLQTIGTWTEDQIRSGGYVLHTLQAALWCLVTTDNYADCVIKAVNLGRDTDTTACVAGALAGLVYGPGSIPADWLGVLAKREEIVALCRRFCDACKI